jgi:hypothetical protein
MATKASITSRVRRELGDLGQPFRVTVAGDGSLDRVETGYTLFSANSLSVSRIEGAILTTLQDPDDYTVDETSGILFLKDPLAVGAVLLVEGHSYTLFSDDELGHYVDDAVLQHTHGQHINHRYRDEHGFIKVVQAPVTLDNLPEVEELLVAILATIEALWALTTDASTDIDIQTADGTHVPRSQRYQQLRMQIDVLTEKYQDLCQQLNVGLHRIEVSNLRRVSRTTGRLVPVFREREYDDYSYPIRMLPPIDQQYADYDGPPSPAYQGY